MTPRRGQAWSIGRPSPHARSPSTDDRMSRGVIEENVHYQECRYSPPPDAVSAPTSGQVQSTLHVTLQTVSSSRS
ncbi:hypothetical protein C8T65DRAFT_677062 [Cerioporus squamosus]|nr:hypothetical protein C8T65DRAFT_677062 [Cerioporus squamosus]